MDVRMDPQRGKPAEGVPTAQPRPRAPVRVADVDRYEAAGPGPGTPVRPGLQIAIEHAHIDLQIALTNQPPLYGPQGKPAAGMTRDEALRAIRDWIRSLFEQQGLLAEGVEELTPEDAERAVGEGGYYSAEETAKRIVDFARSISGGDAKLATTIRDAFEEGFRQAEAAFGGKLPEISYRTRDLVRKGFDELFGAVSPATQTGQGAPAAQTGQGAAAGKPATGEKQG